MSAWDAKIVRVDEPEPGLLSLSLRAEGRNQTLLVVTLPGALGLGVVERRPRGRSASPSTSKLRRHIEGGRIDDVSRSRRAVRISLIRSGTQSLLVAATARPYGAWWLCEPDGSVVLRSPGAPSSAPDEGEHLASVTIDVLRELGDQALGAHQSARRQQLRQPLRKQLQRLAKKREAILGDLERAAKADELRQVATLILANSSQIPSNSTHFEAMSWDDEPRLLRIELDPRKTPTELAEELFRKSKRLARGRDVAPRRLEAVERELERLRHLHDEVDERSPAELAAELERLGVSITAPKERARKRRQAGTRPPYREFEASNASAVLVGRGAADNDRLTLRVARPHDLWLHARGVTGAHVVVRLGKGQACPPETLVDAATLAAHFSDLRGEPIVDVIYTPRRFVHKRKGAAVGSVTLEREKVIAVRVEPERLQRLLRDEKKPS